MSLVFQSLSTLGMKRFLASPNDITTSTAMLRGLVIVKVKRLIHTAIQPLDSFLATQKFARPSAVVNTLASTLAIAAMLLKSLQILRRRWNLVLLMVKRRQQGFKYLLLSLLFAV